MDQNASANVQVTQPDPTPAPQGDVANGTTPAPAAADVAAGATPKTDPGAGGAGNSFDPEIQKFLDNQNIKTDDLAAAVTELAKRNMKLRGNSEPQSVAEVLNQKPQTQPSVADQVKEAAGQTSGQAPEQKPEQKPEPQQTSTHQLSDMDIANVSLFVKQQYPDVTTDAAFYKDMIADGFKPISSDGQINLKSVMSYAKYKQTLLTAEKTIKANEPQAGQIPQPSTQPEVAQVDRVQTMDDDAAANIIMWHNQQIRYGRPGHPQYEEAVKFLQDKTRNGK